jgi:hypothetical protein
LTAERCAIGATTSEHQPSPPPKEEAVSSRRLSLDLAPNVSAELDSLSNVTGLKYIDLFRYALSLLVIYVKARQEGKKVFIAAKDDEVVSVIELPLFIKEMP